MSGTGRDSLRLGAVVLLVLVLGLDPALADTLSGMVTDTGGVPLADVDFDVFRWDGAKLPADGTSDSDGSYEVVLPAGRYDVVCQPPSSSGLAAQVRRRVQVAGKTRLDWRLPASVRVLGRVQALDGTPLAGADLDFDRVADGTRQPAEGDTTDLSGVFVPHVEAGTYRITIFPPDDVDLAPSRLALVTVPSSDTLRFTLLPAAHLSGRVRGPRNGSVAGARLVFVEVGTGVRVPAWGHVTASDGTFRAGIAPGRYEVVIEPPSGSRLVALLSPPLDLNSDRTENSGVHDLEWDGRNESGGPARAGVYFVRAVAEAGHAVTRLVLLP